MENNNMKCEFLDRSKKVIESGDKNEENKLLLEIEEMIFFLFTALCLDKDLQFDTFPVHWECAENYLKKHYPYKNGIVEENVYFFIALLEKICSQNKRKYTKDYLVELSTQEMITHFTNEVFALIKNNIANKTPFPSCHCRIDIVPIFGVGDVEVVGNLVVPFSEKCFSIFFNEKAKKFKANNEKYGKHSLRSVRFLACLNIDNLDKILFSN